MTLRKDIYNVSNESSLTLDDNGPKVTVSKSRWSEKQLSLNLNTGNGTFSTRMSTENAIELAHGILAVVHGQCVPEEVKPATETAAD
jgi:hypothetical protein